MKTLSPELKQARKSLAVSQLITFVKIVFKDENDTPIALRFTDAATQDWYGETWANSPFLFSEITQTTSGEKSRPKLNLPNENGVYTSYIQQGLLDNAEVTRYKALPGEAGSAITSKQCFYISRIITLNSTLFVAQLRRLSDGNRSKIPGGRYISPEFPSVVL